MCGIVGIVGRNDATEVLLNGLEKLEYRGYDSAGIYVSQGLNKGSLVKVKGKIADLRAAVHQEDVGNIGIGHTRWATHGQPSKANAHPQSSADGRFYLVHNGVLENYESLKAQYLNDIKLQSQTDTEVAVNLVATLVQKEKMSVLAAWQKMVQLVKGSYAFVLIDRENPQQLYVAKNKSPLLIGTGATFNGVCSDSLALLNVTNSFIELHDGDTAVISSQEIKIFGQKNEAVKRKTYSVTLNQDDLGKGTYPYYMLKEINEQPAVLRFLEKTYLNETGKAVFDSRLLDQLAQAEKIYFVAAGTSYHAGLVGKALIEKLAQIPVSVELASEFGYHLPILAKNPFFIFLSQSGETADSRQVLLKIKKLGYPSLTITNVDHSTLSREADFTVLLHAGPEIAVASTKAYTAQITVVALLAQALRQKLDPDVINFDLKQQLSLAANGIQTLIDQQELIEQLAKDYFSKTRNAFYIGRGQDYYASREAALKLKEISYIQTEGFAAGELKHGTISLIELGTPVIALITDPETADLTRGNLKEVEARGAHTLTIASENLAQSKDQIIVPQIDPLLSPLLTVIPAQLLAYFATIQRGYNVDQPRNLAKSVTVE
ncbi:MAG: glutamine--fructose-6-phosphate transaminase (isomerizing) [Bombilactobacillus mellifer]|nr:glutamine--fructose-6-phosphate transaminase (isomerizing) [Bombilactobacillus mellifer]